MIFIIITVFFFTGCSQVQSTPPEDAEQQGNSSEKAEENLQAVSSNEELENKFFVGKWKSEEFEINSTKIIIFLNIEAENNETGLNLSFNLNTTDSYFQPVYFEERHDSLYFYYNDEAHRAEYVLTLERSDLIECNLSIKNSFGMKGVFEKVIEFTPLSDDDEEKYKEIKYTVEPKNLSKIEILREYAEYGTDNYDVNFEYKFDERENMLDIIEENNLDELVEGKSDVETAITLMNWLCERYRHGNPPGGLADKKTPQALMEFADSNGGTTNCRGLSLILAQLIRAYNIKAFHITCMPYEEPFNDCHVVVSVYCESLSKWIMLDPSSNLYLKNEDGEIIGVEELRDILVEGGKLSANKSDALSWYCDYMAGNLIRLQRGTVECYGNDDYDKTITLLPEKYMQNEAKNFNDGYQEHFLTSKDDFWKE